MTREFETVRLEVADGVATLTLARPERLNSFTVQMHAEVHDALARVRTQATARCHTAYPEVSTLSSTHHVNCHLYDGIGG